MVVNTNRQEEQEKIKKLVETIESMGLVEPYKTETYKMMLAQILGNPVSISQMPLVSREAPKVEKKGKEMKQKGNKTGRGNKSDIVIRTEELIASDFFNTPRTMRNIQEKLKEEGYNVELTKISPLLLFLVREKKLKRNKNENKRFVYSKGNNHSGHSNSLNTNSNSS